MSVEEAAQEVRRILRQNDVEETLHYLSTVTRSIEANQHDLRAAIGNSYRDLLAACDGVVGMEKNCLEILAIEAALEKRETQTAPGAPGRAASAAATAPLMPAEWFAKRQQRRGHPSGALTGDGGRSGTVLSAGTTTFTKENGRPPPSFSKAARTQTGENSTLSKLPHVVLPLPPAPTGHGTGTMRQENEKLVDVPGDACALLEERLLLDEELQLLHLHYMTTAASLSANDGAVTVEMANVLAILSEGEGVAAAAAVTMQGKAAAPTPLMRAFPLLSMAQRLQRVQETLAKHTRSLSAGATPEATATVSATSAGKESGKTPAWVNNFHRRATTLETRLIKLLVAQLRRAGDGHARVLEQRVQLERRAAHLSVPLPSSSSTAATTAAHHTPLKHGTGGLSLPPQPTTHRVPTVADVEDRERAEEAASEVERSRRALRTEEKRQLVYLCAVFAECHGVLRALQHSPTLTGALASCAPGVDVARPHRTDSNGPTGEAAAQRLSAESLFPVASLRAREVVERIVFNASPSQQQRPSIEANASATPTRWLLGLVTVLVLREAQMSAARWSVITPARTASASTGERGSDTGVTMLPARTRVFASAAFLSSLGLSPALDAATAMSSHAVSSSFGPNGNDSRTAAAGAPSPSTNVGELSNTTWALRSSSAISALLRGYADYVDLVHVCTTHPTDTAPHALTQEAAVFAALKQAWRCDAELGGNDTQDPSGELLAASGHNVGIGHGGPSSLDELLTWRLRRRSGLHGEDVRTPASRADVSATPSDARARYAKISTAPSGPSSPLGNATMDGTPMRSPASVMTGMENTPGGGGDGGGGGLSTVVRCRGYVETLRASLSTVAELNSFARAQRTTSLLVDARCGEQGDSRVGGSTKLARAATASEPPSIAAPLAFVAHDLVAPVVAAVVIGLAREPVAIAGFGAYEAKRKSSASVREGSQPPSSAFLGTLLQPLSFANKEVGSVMAADAAASVGQTWHHMNAGQWWEETRSSALQQALQRCFTVALESVTFVEACVLRGLINSTLSVTVADGDHPQQPHEERVNDNTAGDGGAWSSLSQVQQTWRALSNILRQHTLMHAPRNAGAEARGSQAASPTVVTSGMMAGVRTSSRMVSHSAVALGGHIGASPTGIDWYRFRGPGNSLSGGERGRGDVRAVTSGDSQGTGDNLFCEEGLEWAQAALRSAQLPTAFCTLLTSFDATGETPAKGSATPMLTTEQQQQAVVAVLSGFRARLFPLPIGACEGEETTKADATSGFETSGHAVQLLQRCLRTLVAAVKAFSATPDHHGSGIAVADVGDCATSGRSDGSMSTSLFTRVAFWLKGAVDGVESALSYLPRADAGQSTPTAREVIHSYETSLLLCVYRDALQELAGVSQHSPVAVPASAQPVNNTMTMVHSLCGRADSLLGAATSLWQQVLRSVYSSALRQHYLALLHGETAPTAAQGADRVAVKSTRRFAGMADSASWIQASRTAAHSSAANGTESRGSISSSISGVAYPAIPTPALTVVMQRTLRLLHQALYGTSLVFGDDTSCTDHKEGTGAVEGETGRASAAAGNGMEAVKAATASRGATVACQLVTSQARYAILEELAAATADLFERELLPSLAASTIGDADDVRLQWLMDVLFISSVWCGAGSSGNGSGEGTTAFFGASAPPSAVALTAFAGGAGQFGGPNGADVLETCIAPGPLQRVAAELAKTCDSVRWRSAAPSLMNAFRRFLSASAALWVVRHETEATGSGADAVSLATVAAMKPLAVTANASASSPMERLLQPREGVDRLALLPIALSNATAAAAGGAGGSALGMQTSAFTMAAPTAAALNPCAASMATSGSVGGSTSRTSGMTSMASYVGAAGVPGFHDGAPVEAGRSTAMFGAAAAGAGAGASSAAAAASSLWGTTQRGWSQLWGSS